VHDVAGIVVIDKHNWYLPLREIGDGAPPAIAAITRTPSMALSTRERTASISRSGSPPEFVRMIE